MDGGNGNKRDWYMLETIDVLLHIGELRPVFLANGKYVVRASLQAHPPCEEEGAQDETRVAHAQPLCFEAKLGVNSPAPRILDGDACLESAGAFFRAGSPSPNFGTAALFRVQMPSNGRIKLNLDLIKLVGMGDQMRHVRNARAELEVHCAFAGGAIWSSVVLRGLEMGTCVIADDDTPASRAR